MPTYKEVSRAQLLALTEAVGQPHAFGRYIDLQEALMEPWSARTIDAKAPYPSLIGDDHSPYEYSVAYSPKGAELRLLLEAQAAQPTFLANHAEALSVNERLRMRFGANLSRFDQIEDLFSPPSQGRPGFSLWHAACLSPDGDPAFKIYLNPQLHGREAADDLMAEIFARFGLSEARLALERLRFRGREQDELKYISLDLCEGARARLKVYVCHHDARPSELERALSAAPTHRSGDAARFCATIAPNHARFDRKPVSSCLAFVGGGAQPYTATMHLPIAHYVESDAVARRNICAAMASNQMDELVHTRVLRAIARRPLDESLGVQSYASYRREGSALRLTVYLSPELFRTGGLTALRPLLNARS